MKYITLAISFFLFFSCGIIKKDKQRTETETKSDLNASKTSEENEEGFNFVLRPFNPDKQMIINGDTITNTIVEKHYYNKTIHVKDTTSQKVEEKKETESKIKESDNTAVFKELFYYIVILIVSLFLIAIAYYHFTKPKNPLK